LFYVFSYGFWHNTKTHKKGAKKLCDAKAKLNNQIILFYFIVMNHLFLIRAKVNKYYIVAESRPMAGGLKMFSSKNLKIGKKQHDQNQNFVSPILLWACPRRG